MATQGKKYGFTTVELLVVAVVLIMLAMILAPVFMPTPHHDHRPQCPNNIRQLALSVLMYAQDHKGQYPGADWATEIEEYVGSRKLFICRSDHVGNVTEPVSYGYNGLLLRPDGTGVMARQVIFPTEVGVVCDATPTGEWPGNGIVYGGGLRGSLHDVTPDPRHGGVVIGYCDGHAKIAAGKKVTVRDTGNGVSRAFVQAVGLGLVTNYAGGMHDFTMPPKPEKATISFGGDPCVAPIMQAALDAWSAKSSAVCMSVGFKGQYDTSKRPPNYLWGISDGTKPKGHAIAVARDALVLIVAKTCKISEVTGKEYAVDAPLIRQLYATGYSAHSLQTYTYDDNSGTRRFFVNTFAENGKPMPIDNLATTVTTDLDMVDCVAGDPYAIGYCSAAFADPDRVRILGFKDAKGKKYHYPNDNPKYATVLPEQPSWPLMRTLYVAYGGKAWREDGTGIANVMLAPGGSGTQALHDGPLFQASYYLPE